MLTEEKEYEKKQGSMVKFFKRMDDELIRPFLIHNYSREKKDRDYKLFKLMQKGSEIEDLLSEADEHKRQRLNSIG